MPTSAFRLLSGAAAADAKPAGACVEIVFVGIRLCDRLVYARPDRPRQRTVAAIRASTGLSQ